MKDNRGQSLMELLVALAISAVVLAGLSYLMFTGIRLYDRSDANIRAENEAQNAVNLMTDHMMEAGGVCMEKAAPASGAQCLLLDRLLFRPSAGGYDAYFAGEALIAQAEEAGGEIYLVSFPNQDFGGAYTEDDVTYCRLSQGEASREAAAEAARQEALAYLTGMAAEDRVMWLMADHVTECEIKPADSVSLETHTVTYADGTSEVQYLFQEPFGFDMKLTVAVQSQTGRSTQTVERSVYTRSRMQEIYIVEGGSCRRYRRK